MRASGSATARPLPQGSWNQRGPRSSANGSANGSRGSGASGVRLSCGRRAARPCTTNGVQCASGGTPPWQSRHSLRRPNPQHLHALTSLRALFSCRSSFAIVDSPSFARRRASSVSRASFTRCFIASWPASRKTSRQAARRAAGMCTSRASKASSAPRRRHHTISVCF